MPGEMPAGHVPVANPNHRTAPSPSPPPSDCQIGLSKAAVLKPRCTRARGAVTVGPGGGPGDRQTPPSWPAESLAVTVTAYCQMPPGGCLRCSGGGPRWLGRPGPDPCPARCHWRPAAAAWPARPAAAAAGRHGVRPPLLVGPVTAGVRLGSDRDCRCDPLGFEQGRPCRTAT